MIGTQPEPSYNSVIHQPEPSYIVGMIHPRHQEDGSSFVQSQLEPSYEASFYQPQPQQDKEQDKADELARILKVYKASLRPRPVHISLNDMIVEELRGTLFICVTGRY